MARGIPTEAVLAELRQSDAKVSYLVGTLKGRLTKLEKELAEKPWQEVRPQLRVKLLPQDGEVPEYRELRGRDFHRARELRRRRLRWRPSSEMMGGFCCECVLNPNARGWLGLV